MNFNQDYLIFLNPSKKAGIKKQLLTICNQYVKSDNVKKTAKRAAWLGNDETHYIRKWEDKDLKDLKLLINLTLKCIEMELLTEELVEDMPEYFLFRFLWVILNIPFGLVGGYPHTAKSGRYL